MRRLNIVQCSWLQPVSEKQIVPTWAYRSWRKQFGNRCVGIESVEKLFSPLKLESNFLAACDDSHSTSSRCSTSCSGYQASALMRKTNKCGKIALKPLTRAWMFEFMFRFVFGWIINEDLKAGGDRKIFMMPLKGCSWWTETGSKNSRTVNKLSESCNFYLKIASVKFF